MYKTRDFLPVIVAALIVAALAIAGLVESNACAGDWTCWVVVPFKILFGNYIPPANAHWLLNFAHQAGKVVLIAGAILSSVQVGISAARHDFRAALARRKKRHTIVCGFGKTGMQIVRNLTASGQEVVVIDRLDDTVNAALCDREGIAVIKGDAADAASLRAAGALRAQTIIVCTGDDAGNMDVALRVKSMVADQARKAAGKIGVIAEMRDPWLYSRLIDHERQALGSSNLGFQLFNTYDNAARVLVRSLPLPPGPEIGPGAFVIVGFGTMGQQLALQIVRAAPAALGAKTKIVIFDRAADQRQIQLLHSCPAIAEFADLQFVTTDISQDSPQVWGVVEKIVRARPLLGVAVCLSDDQASLYAALNVRRLLDNLARIHVPVFLRLEQHAHLGQFAAAMAVMKGPRHRFHVFGGLEELLQPDILIRGELDRLAMAFHAHWLESLADRSKSPAGRPWDMLAETFKMANRRRADLVPIHLAQAGLSLTPSAAPKILALNTEETETLAWLEHRRWLVDRRLLGFAYGEARSGSSRTHPRLVEWERLPEAVREANRNDVRNLSTVLADVGMELRREHRICAYGNTLTAAIAELESEPAEGAMVIADIDASAGCRAAELAIKVPGAALWMVSRDFPEQLPQGILAEPFWEAAAGWVAREQLHGASGAPAPARAKSPAAQRRDQQETSA